jgi:Concanavalin A-like lectin/glucanases superfamily/Polysaccharide lyase/Bacterial Ig domain
MKTLALIPLFLVLAQVQGAATVFRMLTGDYTTINADWSAYENGYTFNTVQDGTPSAPVISTQHFAGSYSIQVQVPTDTSGGKERFEYVIAHASDSDGLHFDNARYCGFAFKVGSSAGFTSSDLFWQAWQGYPWGPPASLKLTTDSSAPYTVGLYIRNMLTGPDSAVSDVKLWSSAMIQTDTWYSVVIYLSPSYTNNNGSIRLSINGTNFVNCTTNIGYDPSLVAGAYDGLDIKNGMYQPNANNGHTMYFDQIMFADTFDEAAATPPPTNTLPTASTATRTILRNTFADVDLATLAHDAQIPSTQCLYSVSSPSNGTVVLLADGHTARFTPAANFIGAAGYTFIVTGNGEDPRTFLHYSFEPPYPLSEGFATDASGHFRDGNLLALGTGAFDYSTDSPLPPYNSSSLHLTKSGTTNAARLSRYISNPAELNLSDSSWTFGGWFQRAATTNHDFLFYIGSGDGFGGDGDELQFYCPGGSSTLAVQHYNASNVLDVNASSPPSATTARWHHAALTFQRTNTHSGILCAYLDGAQFATTNVAWTLKQQLPLVFGGHNNTNSNINRWFNGGLDDLVLFTNALSAAEVFRLASETVSQFGGLTASNTVNITVTDYAPAQLSHMTMTNDVWSMFVTGEAGATYTVQAATNLLNPLWLTLATNVSGAPPFLFVDPYASNFTRRFYQAVPTP